MLNPQIVVFYSMEPPVSAETIVDYVWGISLFFSEDEQERKFGEDLKSKWESLPSKYKNDAEAVSYFDNVNIAMGGPVYDLAQLRERVTSQVKSLDDLQAARIQDLEDLANLSKDGESVVSRIVGASVGGGATFLQSATNVLGPQQVVYFGIGAAVSYIITEMVLRLYRIINTPRIYKQIQNEKTKVRDEQFTARSKQILAGFLKRVNAITDTIYKTKIPDEKLHQLSDLSATIRSISIATGSSAPSSWFQTQAAGSIPSP